MEWILDCVLDSVLDTLKLLPFLYLTYLLMEFLEHRSGNATERLLRQSGNVGPLFGGLLGVVPQCGFSAAASGLYAGRIISVGTLLAVYLSTSDEMLPILISNGISPLVLLKILAVKFLIAVAAGFLTDLVFRLIRSRHPQKEDVHIEDICEREHCHCEDHIALSALKHTLRIAGFLLLISLALNFLLELVGEDRISSLLVDRPVLGPFLASLVGLIPNCASSVVLTKLFLSNVITAGTMIAGLCVNAGIGLLVLFRNNRPVKDSFRILGILFFVGFVTGVLLNLTPISSWIGI